MTHKHAYRIHTWPGFMCSFLFWIMSIIALGFLSASIGGIDDYVSQSINWKNTIPGSDPFGSATSAFVLAYTKTIVDDTFAYG